MTNFAARRRFRVLVTVSALALGCTTTGGAHASPAGDDCPAGTACATSPASS
ncbi:hypothetical protein ACFYOG_06300 [Streptomyces sp. NPDC007818]|uniref:hypothetical protein n=1 Tax=Streptomyces sp. NPDC007818 TaxID=3364780 RepID=UPI003679638B